MCVGDALWGCLEQRLDRVRESSRCLLKESTLGSTKPQRGCTQDGQQAQVSQADISLVYLHIRG